MNLGVLCYFKYRGFFLNELHDALRGSATSPATSKLDPLAIIIPFGITFYTFEAISYTVDVYRGKIAAEQSLPRLPAVHPVLPAPGRRADRPRRRLPAADPPAEALELGAGAGRACSCS